jgi:glycosyltransferase involved in cell wall biosynthesis
MNNNLSVEKNAPPSVSIVIPVYNGGESFQRCLNSLSEFAPELTEVIVVVDGATDKSQQLAEEFQAKVIVYPTAGGPARARNIGAKSAQGDIIIFIDADVTIVSDIVNQVSKIFYDQPDLAALIGSYDDKPWAANFLSQYKNLFHHYTHQTSSENASTFWGACGAIRRDIFLEIGGFDEAYRYPSVEDIELGYRLKKVGYRIQLCKSVQVKHLKQWKIISLIKAEFFYRALPWTELIWRERQLTANDLNLKLSSRISLLLAYGILASIIISCWFIKVLIITSGLSLSLFLLNLPVYKFFHHKRGFWFTIKVVPWHWFYFLYGGLAFLVGTIRYHLFSRHKSKKEYFSHI